MGSVSAVRVFAAAPMATPLPEGLTPMPVGPFENVG